MVTIRSIVTIIITITVIRILSYKKEGDLIIPTGPCCLFARYTEKLFWLPSHLLPILVSSLDWSEILLNICTAAAPHLERTNIWGLIYQDWYIGTIQERHNYIRQYTMQGYLNRGNTKTNKQPGNKITNTNIRNKLGVFARPPTPQPDCFTPWYGNTGTGSPG